jgi:hypothetical protein
MDWRLACARRALPLHRRELDAPRRPSMPRAREPQNAVFPSAPWPGLALGTQILKLLGKFKSLVVNRIAARIIAHVEAAGTCAPCRLTRGRDQRVLNS